MGEIEKGVIMDYWLGFGYFVLMVVAFASLVLFFQISYNERKNLKSKRGFMKIIKLETNDGIIYYLPVDCIGVITDDKENGGCAIADKYDPGSIYTSTLKAEALCRLIGKII